MKNLFALIIMSSLILPVYSINGQEDANLPDNSTTNIEELSSDEIAHSEENTLESADSLSKTTQQVLPSTYKQPLSKKKLAKKFIIAMMCVAGTSAFLYIALSFYNKIRDGFVSSVPFSPEGEKPLDTPQDLTEAVKTFLDKTHWEG